MTLVRNGAARPRGRRVPPRAAKAALASLLVASGWLASCSSTTTQAPGLEVVVKTDRVTPGVDFDTLAVRVEQEEPGGTWGVRYQDSKPVGVLHLPLSLAVSRGASADQSIRITVSALAGASTVVARTAQLLMPSDRVAELLMVLSANCLKKTCSDPLKSCQPETGTCASSVIETSSLGSFSPADVTVDAAAFDASGGDATTAASDAGAQGDATLTPPADATSLPPADAGGPACVAGTFNCVGQQPQTCVDGQWHDTGPACVAQACDAKSGTCTGVCQPMTPQCVVGPGENAVRTCKDDGTWGDGVACVKSTCVNGTCQGCLVGATRCSTDNSGIESCDGTGAWGAATSCAKGLCNPTSGQCEGNCTQGDTQCSGTASMQNCGADGKWAAAFACVNQTCPADGKKCQGECATGSSQCALTGNVKETCDPEGSWAKGAVTVQICGAQCTPVGFPGCNATAQAQSCTADGVLTTNPVIAQICTAQCTPAGFPACDSGAHAQSCSATGVLTTNPVAPPACSAVCTPGTSPAQCFGITPQTCGADGQWVNGTTCTYGCSGQGVCAADPAIRNYAAARGLIGTYAERARFRTLEKTNAYNGNAEYKVLTSTYALATIVDDPANQRVLMTEQLCHIVATTNNASISESIRDRVPTSTTPSTTPLVVQVATDNTVTWSRGPVSVPIGFHATSQSPQLPTSASDARVFDQDNDGHPGVTLSIAVTPLININGDAYFVELYQNALSGSISNGRFAGSNVDTSVRSMLDATDPVLKDSPISSRHDTDTTSNDVELVLDNATCSNVSSASF